MSGQSSQSRQHPASSQRLTRQLILIAIAVVCAVSILAMQSRNLPRRGHEPAALKATSPPTLLSDPFLQLPTSDSV